MPGTRPLGTTALGTQPQLAVTGTLAATETKDVASFAGFVGVSGALAATESADTASFAGNVGVSGTLATTEGADTAAFAGYVGVSGPLAATETQDTASFTGTVGDGGITGTLAATETADTAAFSGDVGVSGVLATTEGADTASIAGFVGVSGTLAATETADTAAFTVTFPIIGTLAATEAPDTFDFESRPPGSGKNLLVTPWLPEPAYEVKRAKPFRPIWDIRRRQEQEEARRKAAEPPPLPPSDIFSGPRAKITVKLQELPDFSSLVPGDWHDIGPAIREAQDATDAEIVLETAVQANVDDISDAFAVLQATADRMMAQALAHAEAAHTAAPRQRIEIAMPARNARRGALTYGEQMQDVADHADAFSALRDEGLVPEEV